MTREELLRKLEVRIEHTLGRLGIDATVVSLGRSTWVGGGMVAGGWRSTGASSGFGVPAEPGLQAAPSRDDEGSCHGLSGGAIPLSLRAGGEALSDDVLEVVRETVREFVAEHALDFVRHFSTRPDPKTLN
jgi:hypothetical protein